MDVNSVITTWFCQVKKHEWAEILTLFAVFFGLQVTLGFKLHQSKNDPRRRKNNIYKLHQTISHILHIYFTNSETKNRDFDLKSKL